MDNTSNPKLDPSHELDAPGLHPNHELPPPHEEKPHEATSFHTEPPLEEKEEIPPHKGSHNTMKMILAVAFIFASILAVLFYFLSDRVFTSQNTTPSVALSPTPTVLPLEAYFSDEFGYSFMYPVSQGYVITESQELPARALSQTVLTSPMGGSMTFTIYPNPQELDAETWVARNSQLIVFTQIPSITLPPALSAERTEVVTFGNNQFVQVSKPGTSEAKYFIVTQDNILEISSTVPPQEILTSLIVNIATPSVSAMPVEPDGGIGGVACTMDARMCPDGTYVGRVGPNCEFAPCPGN